MLLYVLGPVLIGAAAALAPSGSSHLTSPATRTPSKRPEKMIANPESTFQPTSVSMTRRSDGGMSYTISFVLPPKNTSVEYEFDAENATFTATEISVSSDDLSTLDAAIQSRPQQLDEDPNDGKCEDVCSGQAIVLVKTEDPVLLAVATTLHQSMWSVATGPAYRCVWSSNGAHGWSAYSGITHWFLQSEAGSYPNGAYMYVNHHTDTQFYNFDWYNPTLMTFTAHHIAVNRQPSSPTTNVTITYDISGEHYQLLHLVQTTAGSTNNCH